VVSTGLKIPYSFLYREYINHIHLLNFLLLLLRGWVFKRWGPAVGG
jgi:hypothetical protein